MKTERRLSDFLVEFARTPITDFPFQSILYQIGHGDRLTSGEDGFNTRTRLTQQITSSEATAVIS